MALVLKDRVQETATPNTTVSFSCNGPVTGFQAFSTIGNGNTTYYTAVDGSGNWECGLGTYTTAGNLVTRTTISASSNAGSAVTFSGAVSLFVNYPATKSVNLDASGNVSALGTVASGTWQGSTVGVAYGGTGVTASTGANSVVLRDANENIIVNSVTQELTSTISSAAITTLTPASSHFQVLTGTTTQTYKLPDATSLPTGSIWVFDNDSTGNLTVTDNAGTTIDVVAAGGYATVFLEANGTVGGEWGRFGMVPSEVNWGTNSLNLGGLTVITNGTWNGATIAYNYGGTGLTSFAAANNALYSTSASTLTAGTLPVLAGGTGVTTSTGTGSTVLSAGPTFTGTVNTANLAYTGTLTGGTGVVAIGTNQIYKDASGNVGIGTSSPSSRLTVSATTNYSDTYGLIQAYNTGTSATDNASLTVKNYSGTSQFMQWEAVGLRIGSRIKTNTGAGNVVFTYGNDSEAMRITSAGGVSFGATGTAYGTSGQVLSSAGNAPPTWINQSSITSGSCTGNAATATSAGALQGLTSGANGSIYTDVNWAMLLQGFTNGGSFGWRPSNAVSIAFTCTNTGNLNAVGTISGTNITAGGNVTGSSTSCTGNAASATYLNSSNYIQRTGSSGNANTDFQNTPAGSTRIQGDDANLANGPGNTWWIYQNMRHSNGGNYWGTQVAWGWEDNANRLATRNVSGGGFGGWVYYLNSANYTSYAPSLTGGGASGTWGINVTGSSTSCSGNAATASNVIGNGQTWQNVLGSRAKNTTYTNSTGRSIMVNIVALQTGSAPLINCQGITVAVINGSGSQNNVSFICPSGGTYIYSGTGGTLTYWAELR